MTIEYTDDKDFCMWATGFSKKYPDVLQHWKDHGDPLKKGLALLVLQNESVTSSMKEQRKGGVQV